LGLPRVGETKAVPSLEVVPRPTPAERYDAAIEVRVDEPLAVQAATIEDWVAPHRAWELTLREGTDFDRPNNVEAVLLFAIGEQTSSLAFRLDQLDSVHDLSDELSSSSRSGTESRKQHG
jgi:hypothetical protein